MPQSRINYFLPSASSNEIESLKEFALTEDKQVLNAKQAKGMSAVNGLQKQCSIGMIGMEKRKLKTRTRDGVMATSEKGLLMSKSAKSKAKRGNNKENIIPGKQKQSIRCTKQYFVNFNENELTDASADIISSEENC